MNQENPDGQPQIQDNLVKDANVSGDLIFAPVQIGTKIETQIVQISVAKVTQQPLIKTSPYQGLKRFNLHDRERFFGRDKLIARLFKAVNRSNLSLVLGASGSGKSSVVRAGLIPELKKSLESSKFYDFIFTPNEDPFESLYRCLLNEEKDYSFRESEAKIVRQAKTDTLTEVINTLKKDDERWLIFVDQFEELFTNCHDSNKRNNFIESLVRVSKSRDNSVKIILAMRADFLEQLSSYPALGAIINQNNIHLVTDMHPDELRQAIEQPAAKHGVVFEEGLVEQLIKEVEGQSGYLPLLQYTLDLLWKRECQTIGSDGHSHINARILNKTNYVALGGVRGALQKQVDEIYQDICQKNKDGDLVTKQIFLKLVYVVESDSGSRAVSRRAYRYEFVGKSVETTLKRFIDENLLVSSYEYLSEEELRIRESTKPKQNATIEIAHEILLSSWDKLKRWLEEEKEAIILKNWLAVETRRWLEVRAEDQSKANDELLKGSRLGQIVEFREENTFEKLGGLVQEENEFIDASIKWREREAKLQRRIIRGLTVGLITVSMLAGAAIWQWHRSTISEINALSNSAEAFLASEREFDALLIGLRAGRKIQNKILGVDTKTKIKLIGGLQNIFNRVKEFNRLEGHKNIVKEIVFSPDGQTLASASNDKTVKLWNLKGQLLHTLKGHTIVTSVVFSSDGQTLASVGGNGTVTLWNLEGQLLHTLEGHKGYVTNVVFSPDGQTLASASKDGTVKLWNQQGQLLHNLEGHKGDVTNVVFSPDGQTLASASYDRTVKLWNQQGQLLHTLEGHTDDVRSVVFSPDGQTLASASVDNKVKLWNQKGQLLHTLKGHQGYVTSVVFSPDGQTLASASNDDTIKLWNLKGQLLHTLKGHQGDVTNVVFSPDGQTLASASSDDTIKLWNLKGQLLHTLKGHTSWVDSVVFSPNGQTLASASRDRTVKLWNLERQLLRTLEGHTSNVESIVFSPDGQTLASASLDKTIKLWNLEGQLLHTLEGHTSPVKSLVFSPDGQTLASASNDKTVKLWNQKGQLLHTVNETVKLWNETEQKEQLEKLLHTLKGHTSSIGRSSVLRELMDNNILLNYFDSSVVFSPDGQTLASAGDTTIKLWNLKGQLLHTLEGHTDDVRSVVFSPDGQTLASADYYRTVKLWNLKGQLLHTLQGHTSVVFSPDGQTLASAGGYHTVKLWNLEGQLLHTLEGHTSNVKSIVFSPDGQTLASAGGDNTVKLWNLKGQLLHTLEGHTRSVTSVVFSPDSQTLASASLDKTIKLWSLDLDEVLTRGCNWARDYLTNNPNVSEEDRKLCNSIRSSNSHQFNKNSQQSRNPTMLNGIKNMYVVNTRRKDNSGRVYQVDESELWILKLRQNGNTLTGKLLGRSNLKNQINSPCLQHSISGYVDDNKKITLLFTSIEKNCCKGAMMQFEGLIDESGIVNGKRYPVGDVPNNCTLPSGTFKLESKK